MLFGLMIKQYQRNLTQLNTTFCPNLSICCLKDELWGMSKKGLTKLTDPIRETCVKVIGFFCRTNWAKWGSLLQLSSDGVIKLYQFQCVPNYAFSQSNSYLSRDFAENLSFAKIYSVSWSAIRKLWYCLFL